MIDHVGVRVSDVENSKLFYEKVLAPLGYSVDFGKKGVFWAFSSTEKEFLFEIQQIEKEYSIMPVHVAFRVQDKDSVHRFYEMGLESGGGDNGAPGLRPEYTENYFAAFILDLDGHNIEAVFLE